MACLAQSDSYLSQPKCERASYYQPLCYLAAPLPFIFGIEQKRTELYRITAAAAAAGEEDQFKSSIVFPSSAWTGRAFHHHHLLN